VPQRRLHSEDIDFIMAGKRMELSNAKIAKKLGVTEGAIRYRLKRKVAGKEDGRKCKHSQLDRYQEFIGIWLEEHSEEGCRPELKVLESTLRHFHAYSGSYDALRRYATKKFPDYFKHRSRIRIETPPGKLLQVDWKEDIPIQLGEWGKWVKVNALVSALGFSRKFVVFFSEKRDLNTFITLHQETFQCLGGLPDMLRTDCLKSAVLEWCGEHSRLNERYRRFLSGLAIAAFPSRPGTPTDKGKVEKRIKDIFARLDLKKRMFRSLAHLQQYVDDQLRQFENEWMCGATGLSIRESFAYEREHLRPLPNYFAVQPIAESRLRVRRDGTVHFAGNYYQVPRAYVGKEVLCQHLGQKIVIYHQGEELERYDYLPHSKGMVRLSEKALSDPGICLSDTVRNWGLQVARRQVEIYHELIDRRI